MAWPQLLSSPNPHSAPWLRSLSQTALITTWAKCSSCLFIRSRFQFADSLQSYSNKTITFSHENQGSLSPLDTTRHLYAAPGCLFLSTALVWLSTLFSVLHPWPVRICNQWTSTSVCLICLVLDVGCSNIHIILCWESPSH